MTAMVEYCQDDDDDNDLDDEANERANESFASLVLSHMHGDDDD